MKVASSACAQERQRRRERGRREIKDGEGKIDSLLRFYLQSIGSYNGSQLWKRSVEHLFFGGRDLIKVHCLSDVVNMPHKKVAPSLRS